MKKHQLQTLSPIDGRYADKCTAIRDLFSEESLIRYRVITEIRWLQFLAQEKEIPMTTDWVVTMITPVDKVLKMYKEDVLKAYGENNEESDQVTDLDDPADIGLTD